jgi:hypothetical protein
MRNLHISMRKHLLDSFEKIYILNLQGYLDENKLLLLTQKALNVLIVRTILLKQTPL